MMNSAISCTRWRILDPRILVDRARSFTDDHPGRGERASRHGGSSSPVSVRQAASLILPRRLQTGLSPPPGPPDATLDASKGNDGDDSGPPTAAAYGSCGKGAPVHAARPHHLAGRTGESRVAHNLADELANP